MRTVLNQAVEQLRAAHHVAVLTGAGTSAESGIPTFREAQTGLWARFRPEDLATPEAFARQPDVVWNWYAWRRELVQRSQPNPGHHALVRLARRVARLTLITQKVDGLHQRAGSEAVIELHGNILRIVCSVCGCPAATWTADAAPPRCSECGGYLRPDVVWFGEALPRAALDAAVSAMHSADVLLVVGTSGLVEPAASLPRLALAQGASVIEINPVATPLSTTATVVLTGTAGVIVPRLLDLMSLG